MGGGVLPLTVARYNYGFLTVDGYILGYLVYGKYI